MCVRKYMDRVCRELTIAVFIDAENVPAKYWSKIESFLVEKGKIESIKVYGEKNSVVQWKSYLPHNIYTCKHRGGKKQVVDKRIGVDVDDLIRNRAGIDAVCIVSSDSDFFPLVKKLKKHDFEVYGLGEYEKSSKKEDAHKSYDCFQFLENEDSFQNGLSEPYPVSIRDMLHQKNISWKSDFNKPIYLRH